LHSFKFNMKSRVQMMSILKHVYTSILKINLLCSWNLYLECRCVITKLQLLFRGKNLTMKIKLKSLQRQTLFHVSLARGSRTYSNSDLFLLKKRGTGTGTFRTHKYKTPWQSIRSLSYFLLRENVLGGNCCDVEGTTVYIYVSREFEIVVTGNGRGKKNMYKTKHEPKHFQMQTDCIMWFFIIFFL
jgi:hypothetical protein